ncbi:hypothetical protein BU14_0125s0045 [Porphyra umbilicalis]|uniref:Uncharacterized protein n=1 Tax=Porphyra umbilicalis TaxID=2786 RepID=A0A1X6P907_PORUM|nr:hypothetical protein BU14_0152s0033 [Porphyra umbilicalis]OSX78057.1 hypothetical protein BU14_0125s0045 [Porphyra umbilicalis]|eukprot:OSX77338.1 hypothetical protein BU14_0152s0033 [Porphyra umbilicalis]
MAACKEQLAASRLSLNGIRALQAVAQQEHYPLGRALQRWLSCRLVERLKMCPPSELNKARGSASQAESRTKVTLTIDMVTDKGALDELVQMQSLAYDVPATSSRGKALRTVQFHSPDLLLQALGMAAPLRNWCLSRRFARKDGSTPARVLLEWLCDDQGSTWYVLRRHPTGELVDVAVREDEVFDPLCHAYAHPLVRKTIPVASLLRLMPACPASLRWCPAGVTGILAFDERHTCGKLTLTLPCCVVELATNEVLGLVEAAVDGPVEGAPDSGVSGVVRGGQ